MSEYGETLARYRDEAGLSQRALGAAIGLDYTQLNKIEHGHRPPLRAKYMEPLVHALRLNRSQAEKLVDLAGLSHKVLDFMDEVVDGQTVRQGQGRQQVASVPMPSLGSPAMTLADSLLDITFEQIETIIESKNFSKEQMERMAAGLIDAAKLLARAIKPEHEK
jgi:transcriptional regulator with XRE-family HTH domain